MYILGLSAFYHDSAAALVKDGQIIAAAQEERFTRKKHDASYPERAVEYVLSEAGIGLADVDHIAFYDKPFLKFERLLETYLAFVPKGFKTFSMAMPLWLREKLFQKNLLIKKLQPLAPAVDLRGKLLFAEHHQSHAASAYYPSPFDDAIVLTMDGVGEWATTSASLGRGATLTPVKEIHFPHSLGMLYSAFTYYTGFKVNSGEYKLMGLAPYGEPVYRDRILENLIDLKDDGSFRLDLSYFDYCTGLTMTSAKFDALFDGPPRPPESQLTQREMDLAASVQAVTEEAVLRLARGLHDEYGSRNLCLAGGVSLNCVANGRLLREGPFERIWIQPAAGDAGGALGAALAAHHEYLGNDRPAPDGKDAMFGAYLGPSFSQAQVEQDLTVAGAKFDVLSDDDLFERTAQRLADGKAVGWFQGRMEFGPRALGGRSILGDPRSPVMQRELNLKTKFRESFRPFAPSVLAEQVFDWFDLGSESPYMLLVADVAGKRLNTLDADQEKVVGFDKLKVARSTVPAITHVDGSARVQTVHQATNPRYYRLISAFNEKTGCPVVINTSFNIRGEPIVCTPDDAFRCFMGTNLDVLVVENCFLEKEWQDQSKAIDYRDDFVLD